MKYQDTEIKMEVVRADGGYTVGQTGVILEKNDTKQLVRVLWKNDIYGNLRRPVKTWISAESIEPASIPYEIIRGYYDLHPFLKWNPAVYKKR